MSLGVCVVPISLHTSVKANTISKFPRARVRV